MKILGKNIETRTLLIVLLVILIILSGYYLITSLPAEVKYLTPEEVSQNKNNYLNDGTITIRGFYDSTIAPEGAIVSSISGAGRVIVLLNYDNVKNATDILVNGVRFYFTGTLHEEGSGGPSSNLVLVASKIESV